MNTTFQQTVNCQNTTCLNQGVHPTSRQAPHSRIFPDLPHSKPNRNMRLFAD
jgi:hypothetical protein